MSSDQRQTKILQRIAADGYVEARTLAEQMGVDVSTIRRDLDALARSGQVRRTHGGARPTVTSVPELPYEAKQEQQTAQKRAIAASAAEYVQDGDTVILDSGSTTYEIARELVGKQGLTVMTNDLRICKFLASAPNVRLMVSGGELLTSVYTLVGDHATRFFDDYTADIAFLGADAVDVRGGVTNTNTWEVPVKRAMIEAAETIVLVADSTKFGQRALARVAPLADIDTIVTDAGLAEAEADRYGDGVLRVGD